MGIALILVMGMLAFIINIGLFVKAKINLQNAVDAAAFAGAATQARQLTNISNVNWEMRNTYKEWMFKYYILGQMGLVKGNNNLSDGVLGANSKVSFLLRTPSVAGTASSVGFDKYNVPSICVHNNSSTDICPIYALPGIPRFPAIGVAGISEIHEAFVNKLVEEKGENCSARTQINFLAALSWAYSSGIKEIPGAPLIATNRAGAWPEALELSMRMRNLEMIVNRPPVKEIDRSNISSLINVGAQIGLNERPVKAFMSAFRNLSGGAYKDKLESSSTNGDELAGSFKLTELAPQPFQAPEQSVSGFLIPSSFTYPGEASVTALTKHYLDLQAVPVNFATMFTTFATTRNEFEPSVDSEASCFVSKSAMPVPGYLMGFVKNPTVLTYYAVKGEADFTGLFFPRLSEDQPGSFKLTAYAAAKPFGGRIGPKLFGFLDGDRAVVPRADDNGRSRSYISGIRVELSTRFKPGMPIPPSESFWANDLTSVVGGVPGTNPQISYGIPNMIYDFNSDRELDDQNTGGSQGIQTVRAQMTASMSTSENRGLYNSYQIKSLKQALGGDFTGRNMTSNDLMKALVTARKVTKYDAANYMIPDFVRGSSSTESPNAYPTVKADPTPVPGGKGTFYKLFAPLVGNDLLYKTNNEVGTIVLSYMKANDKAVEVYLEALLQVAKGIYDLPSGVNTTSNINALAARSIHANAGINNSPTPPALVSADPMDATAPTCAKDMASKFNHFFRGRNTQCGIVPLENLMIEYIDKKNTGDGTLYYLSTYYNELDQENIMTGYYPSVRQGASADRVAQAIGPIGITSATSRYSTRRNFYSTKFVPLSKLFANSNDYKEDVFLESDSRSPPDMQNMIQQNALQADSTTGLNNSYYLDF